MADPLNNIRLAHQTLCDHVRTALHTQLGDRARLTEQRREALSLLAAANQASLLLYFINYLLR